MQARPRFGRIGVLCQRSRPGCWEVMSLQTIPASLHRSAAAPSDECLLTRKRRTRQGNPVASFEAGLLGATLSSLVRTNKMLDRERFGSGGLPIWVRNEHLARWRFASGFVEGRTVVDCACGTGHGTATFARASARRIHAFDLSEEAVASARRHCSDFSSVSVNQASGLSLPVPGSSVDVYVSLETIEHVDDDRGFLAEVVRVLSPRGIFIASTPNRSITMPGKDSTDSPWNPFHVREYDASEFAGLLGSFFGSVTLYGQNAQPQWRVSLMQAVGRRMPGHFGGRINSALKLPRFAYDREEHHSVRELPSSGTC